MTGVVTFSEIIDIGFIVALAASCWYALQRSNADTSSHAANWKQELTALRDSLQSLITEASVASHNLDKNLQRRQDELEHLLRQIQTLRSGGEIENLPPLEIAPSSRKIEEEPVETLEDDLEDFPNASWLKPSTPTPAVEAKPELEVTKQIKKKLAEHASRANSAPSEESIDQRLKDAIEVSRETDFARPVISGDNEKRELNIKRPSSVDPVAYKVAKRLLERGQPIHVVARKVDLSTAEVRELYKLVNPDGDEADLLEAEEASNPGTFIELKEELSSEEEEETTAHNPLFEDILS